MRMLSIAAREGGYVRVDGKACSVEDIAVLVGRSVDEVAPLIAELGARSVFSRTRDGTCYNRRMTKDEKRRKKAVISGRKGGNPALSVSHSNNSIKSPTLKGDAKGHIKGDTPLTLPPLTSLIPFTPEAKASEEEREACAPPPNPQEHANGRPARKTRLPDGWQPDIEDCRYASGRGHDGRAIADQADAFRDHHTAKQTLSGDWNASWRTWVRHAEEYADRNRAGRNGATSNAPPRSGSITSAIHSLMSRADVD